MADQLMDVGAFLQEREDQIQAAALPALSRARLTHYEAAGAQAAKDRLSVLLERLIRSCHDRNLDAALSYADSVAIERYGGGYTLAEIQTTINIIEEVIWQSIAAEAPPASQGYALGLVSTVLGAVKDRLACKYIEQITSHPAKTLRLDYLLGWDGSEAPET